MQKLEHSACKESLVKGGDSHPHLRERIAVQLLGSGPSGSYLEVVCLSPRAVSNPIEDARLLDGTVLHYCQPFVRVVGVEPTTFSNSRV